MGAWRLCASEARSLSTSPALCGACSGRPSVAMAHEGPGAPGWTARSAVSASVDNLHCGNRYTAGFCIVDALEAPTNVLLTFTGQWSGQVFVCPLGHDACSLEVAEQGVPVQGGNFSVASTCGEHAIELSVQIVPATERASAGVTDYVVQVVRTSSSDAVCALPHGVSCAQCRGRWRRPFGVSSPCMVGVSARRKQRVGS